jgi:hypothetical protein
LDTRSRLSGIPGGMSRTSIEVRARLSSYADNSVCDITDLKTLGETVPGSA